MTRWTIAARITLLAMCGLVAPMERVASAPKEASPRPQALERARPAGEELPLAAWLQEFLLAQAEESEKPEDLARVLYEKARAALNRDRYREAARDFELLFDKHPRSAYADDALYWRAFAMHRLGSRQDLGKALEALDALGRSYKGSTFGEDARALDALIRARLAELGDARSAAEVRENAETDDEELKLIALDALLHTDAESAVPLLRRILIEQRSRNSSKMREKAVFILSQKGGPETTQTLLDVAKNDPDIEVRGQAVFWLSQVSDEEAVPAIEEILHKAEDENVQEKALYALSQHRSERAARILREYAVDASKPEELREHAIFWLGQHQGPENLDFLQQLYAQLESDQLKEKVLFAVSQQMGRPNQDWLMERARDPRESLELRKQALFWAGQQGTIPCGELRGLHDFFKEPELQEHLVFVLSQRRDPLCVDALIDLARNARSTVVRKQAIFWLGHSRDPRAIRFLEELIEQ